MASVALAKNGIQIRPTDERWAHIADEHGELESLQSAVLEAITDPLRIVAGEEGESLALR